MFEKFAGDRSQEIPPVANLMETSLDEALSLFNEEYEQFIDDSDRLYRQLSNVSFTPRNYGFIYNQFEEFDFWGVSLYVEEELRTVNEDEEPLVWKGFNLSPLRLPGPASSFRVSIQRSNNVTYLFGQRTIILEDQTAYLLTAHQLEHTTNLTFEDRVNTRLSDHPRLDGLYPVHFSFFDAASANENDHNRPLVIQQTDSIGFIYATPEDLSVYEEKLVQETAYWRGLFHLALAAMAMIFFIAWNRVYKKPLMFLLRAGILITGFWIIQQSGMIDYWSSHYVEMLPPGNQGVLALQLNYLLYTLLFLLLFLEAYGFTVSRSFSSSSELRAGTVMLSVLYGGGSLALLIFFIRTTRTLILESNFQLLDLELAPDPASLLFYFTAGLLFTSVGGLIITLGLFLNRWESDKSAILSVGAILSFILIYYLTDLFLIEESLFNWIFILCFILLLVLIWIVHIIHSNPLRFAEMSGFRKLMITVLISSAAVYAIVGNTSSASTDKELLSRSQEFITEETSSSNTANIVEEILKEIESKLLFFTLQDVETESPILRGQFQRIIRSSIRPEWRQHTFEIQLLDTLGNSISDYSTNLDTPGWRSLVDMELMLRSHIGEELRKETNRPIVWDGPPNLGENYISFQRGWIPIYDDQNADQIIAWVFAAVYFERPDYNKPMRAVLAAATEEEWRQSYYLAEFEESRLTRSSMQGIYHNQPIYNRIPQREVDIAQTDSIAFITNITAQGEFREILLKVDDNTIIKASTPIPTFINHLFSFFRLQMVMIFIGLLIFSILAISGWKQFSLFGQNRKFRDRLLDGLTLATIIFLTVLIFATRYAIGNQNAENVEMDLITKLNSLSESLRDELTLLETEDNSGNLNQFATPLNIDAILYEGSKLIDSTTPQIFNQNLMPGIVPFPVYDIIYNRQRRQFVESTTLAGEQLLIGYRALLDDDSRAVGTVAIPTFVQSPVYREQLLQTTSYLLGVYLLIFGFFIIGTVFFSTSLTRPLQIIQNGLNRISRGDIRGQVDVTSRDEIGSLASAYNQMVERLNDARQELVRAEREAAWKEMAQQVAHEIKNPLTPMKLNLQHLQRQLEANPEDVMKLKPVIESTAGNIIEQIESLNQIASDFSKFAKPVQNQLQPVNLNRVLDSVYDLYYRDSDVNITLSQPEFPVAILAAEDELRRAFINLVKNGIEAHESGKADISLSVQITGDKALVQIHDNGAGIDPETQDKIFVPNFSTKSSGTGLGLAITKKIIEAHNAEIWFESSPGKGSTFFISIPLMVRDSE
jgi:signal transduction histidine kinase